MRLFSPNVIAILDMARTLEAGLFDPDTFISRWSKGELQPPDDRDLGSTIKEAFKLKPNDNYVYHAVASVSLEDMRRYLSAGDVGMLQAWYFEEDNDGNEKKRVKLAPFLPLAQTSH